MIDERKIVWHHFNVRIRCHSCHLPCVHLMSICLNCGQDGTFFSFGHFVEKVVADNSLESQKIDRLADERLDPICTHYHKCYLNILIKINSMFRGIGPCLRPEKMTSPRFYQETMASQQPSFYSLELYCSSVLVK